MSSNTENKYVSQEDFDALKTLVLQNTKYMILMRQSITKLSEYNLHLQKELQHLKASKFTEKSDGDVYIDTSNSHVFQTNEVYATKMCKSVFSGKKCSFGDKCTFAHSIRQLRVRECKFEKCVHVTFSSTQKEYKNVGDKICEFWHKDESQISYSRRLSIPLERHMIEEVIDYNVDYHEYIKGCDCASCDGGKMSIGLE
jgi:Putative zinc finger protein/CCCH-type zinc finger